MIMLMVLMVLEVMELYQVTGKMVLAVAKICEKAAQSSRSGQKVITLLLTSTMVFTVAIIDYDNNCGDIALIFLVVLLLFV